MTVSMEMVRMAKSRPRKNQNARIYLKTILPYNKCFYYMALACGRYNARFDWLIVTEL